jgi:hypothetical protein
LSDKRFTAGAEVVIPGGGDDDTQVEIGVLIRGTPGVGAAQKSGHNSFIGLAGNDEPFQDDPMAMG